MKAAAALQTDVTRRNQVEILSGYNYIDTLSGASLNFIITDYSQYEESLPEIDEDFLYGQPLADNAEIITGTDTRKISRFEVGLLEKTGDLFMIRTFYAKLIPKLL